MYKYVFLLVIFLCVSTAGIAQNLVDAVEDKRAQLQLLIENAENEGLDTRKEKMTLRTADVFMKFAEWDANNIEWNTEAFSKVARYKDNAVEMAKDLARFERSEIIKMLDESIITLQDIIDGKILRNPIPVIDWSTASLEGDQITYNGQPVFLIDYTWKPDVPELNEFHGNQDGFYLDPNKLANESGEVKSYVIDQLSTKPDGTLGFIFFGNKSTPFWTEEKYGPGFQMREDTYTGYDIDNPGAREMMEYLVEGTVPFMKDKKYSELGYLLCNEPHFYTTKDGDKWDWASGSVSEYSIAKFRDWLKDKHKSIEDLNQLWGSDFKSFDDIEVEIPMDISLQGQPIWYDWQTFNNYRVTEWYSWLKSTIRKYDEDAKVHLKVMPNLWSENKRGHGLNMEDINELSDILGNDFGSENSYMWGGPKEWEENYSLEWRELCMGVDFFKSTGPDKIVYNSELHFLSKGSFRDLELEPAYARATFWLAHVHGHDVSQIWYWCRNADGSPNPKGENGNGYAASLIHQPRIVNEVHSTMMDLNSYSEYIKEMQRARKSLRIFYSETSALNKPQHMDDVFELYESLFFEGVPLGFVTEKIIEKQDNSLWDAVLVYQTEFVTVAELDALQSYIDNGGTIILDGESLLYNEYGNKHARVLDDSNSPGKIIRVNQLNDFKSEGMTVVDNAGFAPELTVSERSTEDTRVCTWRTIKNDDGNIILTVTNLGKEEVSLNVVLNDAKKGTACTDLLTGQPVTSTPKLKPYEVYFVEVTDEEPEVSGIFSPKNNKNRVLGKIYPNPTNGKLNIDLDDCQKQVVVELFDIGGAALDQKIYENISYIDYSMSNFPVGVYLLKLAVENSFQTFLVHREAY